MNARFKMNALLGTATLAGAFMLSLSAVHAAEPAFVSKLGGKGVSVTKGSETSRVQVQSLLQAGDRVSAGAESFVEVKYLADGCTIRVSAGNSLVVGAASPCAASTEKAAPDAKTDLASTSLNDAKIIPAAADASAQIAGQSGSITRVNRGAGLVDVTPGESLVAGDTVFAGPGSTVTLYFPGSNCSYMVPAETYFQVPAVAPCTAVNATDVSATMRQQAAITGAEAGSGAVLTGGGLLGGAGGVALAVGAGALLIGGTVFVVSQQEEEETDTPATPF